MRKATLAMMIFWSILALLLCFALVAGIIFSKTGRGIGIIGGADGPTNIYVTSMSGSKELLFDQSFPIDKVQTLRVDLTSDEVDVFLSEDDQLRVIQHGVNLDEHRVVTVKQSGSTLLVSTRRNNQWYTRPLINARSYVEIYLPEAYHEALELDLTSGSVQLHNDRQFNRFLIDITSGEIATMAISADSVIVDMTSGKVHLGNVVAPSFRLDSTSGSMQVESLRGAGEVDITSGTVKLNRLELTDMLSLDLTSGNISVGLVDNPSIDFRAERTSGTINTYFDTHKSDNGRTLTATVGDGPHKTVRVDMTSGTVNITSVG